MADSGPKAPSVPLFRRPGCWIGFLTVIPLLIGGVFLVENWAGARALRRVKAELAASGIELDPRKRPSVRHPDEENFCATPLLLAIGSGTAAGPEIEAIRRIGGWRDFFSKAQIKFQSPDHPALTDWAAVRDAVAAGDPAAGLSPGGGDPVAELSEHIERVLAPVFDELSDALPRPHAYFVLDYWTEELMKGYYPYHGRSAYDLLNLADVLMRRARLDMEAGRMERAAESILILLRLAEGAEMPNGKVVGYSIRAVLLNFVWVSAWRKALPREKWIEWALALRRQRPLDHLPEAMELDMIYFHYTMASQRADLPALMQYIREVNNTPRSRSWEKTAEEFVPRGWFDFNEARMLEACLHLIRQARDARAGGRFDSSDTSDRVRSQTNSRSFPWHDMMTPSILSNLAGSLQVIYAHSHAITRLAEAACALEAWHIDHQAYPASLEALVPDYLPALPADLDGKPVRYAPDPANQRYKLWSIGQDGIDDGGVEKSEDGGHPPRRWSEPVGDWVWRYPE